MSLKEIGNMNPVPRTLLRELRRVNKEIREQKLRTRDALPKDEPVRYWKGEETLYLNGKLAHLNSLTIIFATKGCTWARENPGGGCIFCGYLYDNPQRTGDLLKQLNYFTEKFERVDRQNVKVLKLYTSGSFLDEKEVPIQTQREVISTLPAIFPELKVLQIEARPENLLKDNIETFLSIKEEGVNVYFNIGLESINTTVLRLINKGLNVKTYQKAVNHAKSYGFKIKTYLLLKPPFLTEKEAINDTFTSGKKAIQEGSDSLSINPLTIHSGTVCEKLWQSGLYRPPWPQSIIFVLRKLLNIKSQNQVILSEPVALGTPRGAHGTGKNIRQLKHTLEEVVRSQSPRAVPQDARKPWHEYLEKEVQDLAFSTVV
ncbi:MAG: TIGR01210 family radical SAM protein [Candidatus Korarchaeota archaeon]|nr:TIGR01210 family radical SAM protein [Candidatus Korarchaeota archaeon]NIU84145.1 TIGR01210 family radical SAM protein [Candidatus Thorarchaeota archaeon]NIW14290.1 TIGR01210 family radical SAM protein [Candidatus Thorarchaeota archaeon]NIW52387.1 TIGR01210 family radical SAM protein [Candidatus Korarchaeota archaeon]